MEECKITKTMPFGAFTVFIGSFMLFMYILIDDYYKTDDGERSYQDTIWIYIFFTMLIICIIISGMCIIRSNKEIKNTKFGKKVNKRLDLLSDSFKSLLPNFKGKKII